MRKYISAREFLHNEERWCLWLEGIDATTLKTIPEIYERVKNVRAFRLASSKAKTREDAARPTEFAENRQPKSQYLAMPKTTSERRAYIPIAIFDERVIVASEIFTIINSQIYDFGVLTSSMHNAWMRYTCGRLKSDFRYSAGLVYNNFPWPQDVSDAKHQAIETCAQAVLDARTQFPDSTLADLYDPLTMPPTLLKAHRKLDAAVDAAYTRKKFTGDADRVAFLFEQYQKITSLLPANKPKRKTRRSD